MIDLKSILTNHPNCLSNRAFFKSVLMDKYPSEKRTVNILTILFECGVVNKIKTKKSIDANEMQGLIVQIENEYGISGQYSQDAILVWAAAFDVTASAVKSKAQITSSQEASKPVEEKPVVYVQDDIDDYDVVQKSDGYYIKQFNGFDEEVMTIPSMIDGKIIKGIAQDAFKGCISVKRLHISEGIEVIENGAFHECKAIEHISLPSTLRRIGSPTKDHGKGAFALLTNLESIVIPQSVTFMGPDTFSVCKKLKKVVMSDNITTICKGTFNYCESLTTINFPQKLEKIEELAFYQCKKLKEVHIPVGTKEIGADAFEETGLDAIYVPPSVNKIGDNSRRNILWDRTLGWGTTIYCTAGSAAMEFARKNNMKCAKAVF